jgi:dolichol-phosphate mannosyltransferase
MTGYAGNSIGQLSEIAARPVISIIIPTKNESENIKPLLLRIEQAMRGMETEVIFVDDSTDQTPQLIRDLQSIFSIKIVLIARPPEPRGNGLGGAVVEGFRAARAPLACVMDGDLQHPPELIPKLIRQADLSGADLVLGSRLAHESNSSSLSPSRSIIAYGLAMLMHLVFPYRLRKVSDPLTGLFVIRLASINLDRLHPDGFKILLEILGRFPNLAISEIPFKFGHRMSGQSKASPYEVLRLIRLLIRLRFEQSGHFIYI